MAKEDPRILLRLGFVPDEDVAKILAAGDVVVLPYHRTLTSGAAILAMSYGRSVIVPKMGCVQELSSDMAIHYDPEQADGLQNALLAAETAPLASMGQTAYRFAQRSSWSLIAEKTINVYYAAVQKSTVANVVRQTAPIATQSDYTGKQS